MVNIDSWFELISLICVFGVCVRKIRCGFGMIQIELVEELGYKDSFLIIYIEQGCNVFKLDVLLSLCVVFKILFNELFGWDEEVVV